MCQQKISRSIVAVKKLHEEAARKINHW